MSIYLQGKKTDYKGLLIITHPDSSTARAQNHQYAALSILFLLSDNGFIPIGTAQLGLSNNSQSEAESESIARAKSYADFVLQIMRELKTSQ